MANGEELVIYPGGDPGAGTVVGGSGGSFPGSIGADPGPGGPIGGGPGPGFGSLGGAPENYGIQGNILTSAPHVEGFVPTADQQDAFAWVFQGSVGQGITPGQVDALYGAFVDQYGPGRLTTQERLQSDYQIGPNQTRMLESYGRRLDSLSAVQPPEQESAMAGFGDFFGDIFSPDTPGPGPSPTQEDDWWDRPLDVVSGILRPVAQAWVQRGQRWLGEQIDDLYPPGHFPGGGGMTHEGGLSSGGGIMNLGQGFVQGPADLGVALSQISQDPVFTGPMTPNTPPILQSGRVQPGGPMANQPTSLPGGAMVPAGGSFGAGVACIPPGSAVISQRPRMGMRLPSRVDVPTVDRSGNVRFTTFKNMGRPLLWSGDLAASKRVRKVAAKARRAKGR